MRDTHLHMVAEQIFRPTAKVVGEAFEQNSVNVVDIGLAVHCVAHAQALVPVFLAFFAHVFQGIEGVDG